jgi:hypothetical protein
LNLLVSVSSCKLLPLKINIFMMVSICSLTLFSLLTNLFYFIFYFFLGRVWVRIRRICNNREVLFCDYPYRAGSVGERGTEKW